MEHNTKQETRTAHRHETEIIMPGEGTKESDQGSDQHAGAHNHGYRCAPQ
jgi:hypothetical protein